MFIFIKPITCPIGMAIYASNTQVPIISISKRERGKKSIWDLGPIHLFATNNKIAIFHILLTLVITTSFVVNDAIVRLSKWPGIPPKGYNGNVAITVLEWSSIPPKGYAGEEAKRLLEWPIIPPKNYKSEVAKRLPEWSSIPPKGHNG